MFTANDSIGCPARSTVAMDTPVLDKLSPTECAYSGRSCNRTGLRPALRTRLPVSASTPSFNNSPTISDIAARVRFVSAAISERATGPRRTNRKTSLRFSIFISFELLPKFFLTSIWPTCLILQRIDS
jgi:hypothetical protein